jgi:hypothetical protein
MKILSDVSTRWNFKKICLDVHDHETPLKSNHGTKPTL